MIDLAEQAIYPEICFRRTTGNCGMAPTLKGPYFSLTTVLNTAKAAYLVGRDDEAIINGKKVRARSDTDIFDQLLALEGK